MAVNELLLFSDYYTNGYRQVALPFTLIFEARSAFN